MQPVADGVSLVDVEHLGNPHVIAAGVLQAGAGVAVVDPGPSSSLPNLLRRLADAGIEPSDIRWVILTHIHLDHAGATGTLVRAQPHIEVLVHERGAPHLADPTRLLASATRLYGDDMGRLWGDVLPVPESNIRGLKGGERVALGAMSVEVAYTPGHASHHVSYLHTPSGTAFVGDTAGIRIGGRDYLFPPTPPPTIDLEQWDVSLDRIAAWRPERLFLTHFGVSQAVPSHLAEMRRRLGQWSEWVRRSLETGRPDEALAAEFTRVVGTELRGSLPDAEAQRFEQGATPPLCWYGLARYWRKRSLPLTSSPAPPGSRSLG